MTFARLRVFLAPMRFNFAPVRAFPAQPRVLIGRRGESAYWGIRKSLLGKVRVIGMSRREP